MVICDRLRTLREEKKLSQGDIEKRTGLLRCYITRIENGHTVPTVETLEKMARALEVPMYRLFYDGEAPPKLENLTNTTTVEQYNLTLSMRGPLDKLTTSYVSDPPLATADIINLIARGKTTQESAASSQSTDSMIASQGASQLSSGVQKLAGISSLQIDPTIGGNNQNPSARVAFQQRVTKNLLFTFSTDVSQPGSEIVQGEYQLNKRWSVSMARDQLGGVSVDGKYRKNF